MSSTLIEIKKSDEEVTFKSAMFETFGKIEEEKNNPDKTIYFVRFNSLVSKSIKNKTWRLINYD